MGWGLSIKEVYMHKVTKAELPYVAERSEERLQQLKERLMVIASMRPEDFRVSYDGVEMDPIDAIGDQVTEVYEEIVECAVTAHLARVAMDGEVKEV